MFREYYRKCRVAFSVAVAVMPMLATAEPVAEGADPESGLYYWEWASRGVQFTLTQRLPDQTRAFFLARGFDAESADFVARQCVFQSSFKNTGRHDSGAVNIELDEWVIYANGKKSSLITRQRWKTELADRDIPEPAFVALQWSLLPTQQTYQPDDYNWGMTSYGLEPGTQFDLEFTWHRDGQKHTGMIKGVECPADIHPEPTP